MKSEEQVVQDFNEIVNMSAEELDEFLKTEGSESTGWSKDDGSGESIGHESGRKIVEILKRNPDKDPSKYTDEDKDHMRRVVSYCKRHLAQEGKLKESKTPEELEQTKSTRSLKNWGHDPLKTLPKSQQPSAKPESKGKPKSTGKPKSKGKAAPQDKKEESKEKGKDDAAESAEDDGKVNDKEGGEAVGSPKAKGNGEPKSDKKSPAKKVDAEDKDADVNADADADADAEAGEKRAADGDAAGGKSAKPPSKKAKTTKEPTEGTRKPPSRSAKKA